MDDLEKLNSTLIAEADEILYDYGLLKLLNKYGNPIVTGSYSLNLMTWRDLDIYLETGGEVGVFSERKKGRQMTENCFFDLGREILQSLKPHKMHFRNEFIGKTPNLPVGFYWGIYMTLRFPDVWKIDVWSMDSDQISLYQKRFNDLKSSIDDDKRPVILKIKNCFCKHPEYRKKFFSVDIYRSVLKENVNSIEEFAKWLKKDKGIE